MYDIIVVGAGPAGLTAAIYARRADKSVLVLERGTFGGQITYSPRIENYPGFNEISGNELAEKLMEQAMNLGAEIEMTEVLGVEKNGTFFTVRSEDGDYMAKSVIIATGSKHRQLELDREEEFIGNGISFCAVCDGAFYAGKTIAVIGGGNSALVEAVMLSDIASKLYIIQNLDFLTGEEKLQSVLRSKSNVEIICSTVVDSYFGGDELNGLILKNVNTGDKTRLDLDGVFIAIGQIPENEIFKNLVDLTERGYVDADERCLTKTEGLFVAGDCRSKFIRQISTATADGAIAALAACRYIDDN